MSLSPATIVHQGNAVGGVMPDISSALGYKEHIDSACINPNGYTAGSYFVGADDGYFYCVTANIAAGDTITIGTNCVQTDVAAEIKKLQIKQLKVIQVSGTTNAVGMIAIGTGTFNPATQQLVNVYGYNVCVGILHQGSSIILLIWGVNGTQFAVVPNTAVTFDIVYYDK